MGNITCLFDDCESAPLARGMCQHHYDRERRAGRLSAWPQTRSKPDRKCACGCGQTPARWGAEYVRGHRPKVDPLTRFWPKVEKSEGCWRWTASIGDHGYGTFYIDPVSKWILAHRMAYQLCVGPIPDGMHLDHLCRNRWCVNPDHLEPVTHAENVRRGLPYRAPTTHCKHGHEYTAENTYWNSAGYRECRTCVRARRRST